MSLNYQSKCPITIFFESHTDSAPTKTLANLVDYFYLHNYTIFGSEDSPPTSIDEILAKQTEAIGKIDRLFLNGPEAQMYKDMFVNSVNLLNKVKAAGMIFNAIDLPKSKIEKLAKQYGESALNDKWSSGALNKLREKFMVKHIDATCKKFQSGEIILVGLNHFGLQSLLQEKGYADIHSFYICSEEPLNGEFDIKPDINTKLREDSTLAKEFILKYFPSGLQVIDLYQHPYLNATQEIINYFQDTNQHDNVKITSLSFESIASMVPKDEL